MDAPSIRAVARSPGDNKRMATKVESGLTDYLREIKHYSLLTPEDERELGTKVKAASECERRLAEGEISVSECERVRAEAAAARQRMVQSNLRLVISVAKNFRNRGMPMEDLVNEGNVGLMNAVDRFDPEVGSRFSTYAIYWIDQAIRRALQNATQMIHIPSYLMEQIGRMKLAQHTLERQLGRPASMQELATHMRISLKKAMAISRAIRACGCPNQATSDEDGVSLADSLPDTRTPSPSEGSEANSEEDFVFRILGQITEREARVLQLRYGLNDEGRGKRMTLKEIGAAVGLTRERVRQIEKEAKRKLTDHVKDCF